MTIDELFQEAAHGCQNPECHVKHGPIVMSPRCHPGKPVTLSVDASRGIMEANCSVCDKSVMVINHTMSN